MKGSQVKKIKYLTRVFYQVNDYPMSIRNKIAHQKLNDSQSTNRRGETNETPNKLQLILRYSRNQEIKLIIKMKKLLGKPYQKTYRREWHIKLNSCLQNFM